MFRGHTLGAPTKHCAFEGHRFKLQKFFAITEASSGRTLRSFSECTKAGNFRRMKLISGGGEFNTMEPGSCREPVTPSWPIKPTSAVIPLEVVATTGAISELMKKA
jgi:hypothetical protein